MELAHTVFDGEGPNYGHKRYYRLVEGNEPYFKEPAAATRVEALQMGPDAQLPDEFAEYQPECGPHPAPPAAPTPRCEGWCNGHTSPWAAKCEWTTLACAACPQCPACCLDTCAWANDGQCDDGGPSLFGTTNCGNGPGLAPCCDLGSDCGDCGSRCSAPPPPMPPPSPPPPSSCPTRIGRFRHVTANEILTLTTSYAACVEEAVTYTSGRVLHLWEVANENSEYGDDLVCDAIQFTPSVYRGVAPSGESPGWECLSDLTDYVSPSANGRKARKMDSANETHPVKDGADPAKLRKRRLRHGCANSRSGCRVLPPPRR